MKEEEGEEDEIKTRIRITLREKLLHQISIEQEGMGSEPTSPSPQHSRSTSYVLSNRQ